MKLLFLLTFLFFSFTPREDFLSQQKKYERVRQAYKEKETVITERLAKENIALNELSILIAAFKEEKEFEVYAKRKNETEYRKISTYKICALSGLLGPKRRIGDGQVPEGFYYINRYNPVSSYYLSLGINYPNASDRKKSKAAKPGGDIFIHGECVTIGCLPMTNDKIKEIYLYAIHAHANGQQIPVYIFPFRMSEANMSSHKSSPETSAFWNNLKSGYDKFQSGMKEFNVSVNKAGDYVF